MNTSQPSPLGRHENKRLIVVITSYWGSFLFFIEPLRKYKKKLVFSRSILYAHWRNYGIIVT